LLNTESEEPQVADVSIRSAYFDYKAEVSKKYTRIVILIVAIVNLISIFPDVLLMDSILWRMFLSGNLFFILVMPFTIKIQT